MGVKHSHNAEVNEHPFDRIAKQSPDSTASDSFHETSSELPWGWYSEDEEISLQQHTLNCAEGSIKWLVSSVHKDWYVGQPISAPPDYILESSLSMQQLWYTTAGQRPQQPENERDYYEHIWRQNDALSNVEPVEKEEAKYDSCLNDGVVVLCKSKCPFSIAVSKSFTKSHCINSLAIQIPQFRIVKSKNQLQPNAEFLVIVTFNGKSPLTFGVWKRHSDFFGFANNICRLNEASRAHYKVQEDIQVAHAIHTGESTSLSFVDLVSPVMEADILFHHTVLAWEAVLKHQRIYRCLKKDYLAYKCVLLERFLQAVLSESSNPEIISDGFLSLCDDHTHTHTVSVSACPP